MLVVEWVFTHIKVYMYNNWKTTYAATVRAWWCELPLRLRVLSHLALYNSRNGRSFRQPIRTGIIMYYCPMPPNRSETAGSKAENSLQLRCKTSKKRTVLDASFSIQKGIPAPRRTA
jgi:hypothetical protein